MKNESKYAEVVIDHYDDINNVFTIDTWRSSDTDEEGVVVGTIDLDGKIEWCDEEAQNDTMVKSALNTFFDYHHSLCDSESINTFKDTIKRMSNNDEIMFDVINPDGVTGYSVKRVDWNDCTLYLMGLRGSEDYHTIDVKIDYYKGLKEEDLENIVDYIIEDITSAVGETFMLEFAYYK